MKDAFAMFRRDAGALIGDRQQTLISERFNADRDGRTTGLYLIALSSTFVTASRRTKRSTETVTPGVISSASA